MKFFLYLFVFAIFTSCFHEITLPKCNAVRDCTAGYYSCSQGYCFSSKKTCDIDNSSSSTDGCCLFFSGIDISADEDCKIFKYTIKDGYNPSMPALDDNDNIYISYFVGKNNDKSVYLISLNSDGTKVRWSYELGKSSTNQTIPPVYSTNGLIYAGYDQGVLIINAKSGKKVGSVNNKFVSTNLMLNKDKVNKDVALIWMTDNLLYVMSDSLGNDVRMFDPQTPIDNFNVKHVFGPVGIIADNTSLAVSVSGNMHFFVFQPSTGTYLPKSFDEQHVLCSPLPYKHRIYLVTKQPNNNTVLSAFDIFPDDVIPSWTVDLGSESPTCPVFDDQGNIVLATEQKTLDFIKDNGNTGDKQTVSLSLINDNSPFASPVIGNDDIIIIPFKNSFQAGKIEQNSFISNWNYPVSEPFSGSLTINSKGRIIFSTVGGVVYSVLGSFSTNINKWAKPYGDIYNTSSL